MAQATQQPLNPNNNNDARNRDRDGPIIFPPASCIGVPKLDSVPDRGPCLEIPIACDNCTLNVRHWFDASLSPNARITYAEGEYASITLFAPRQIECGRCKKIIGEKTIKAREARESEELRRRHASSPAVAAPRPTSVPAPAGPPSVSPSGQQLSNQQQHAVATQKAIESK
jgi:hypothetical protein